MNLKSFMVGATALAFMGLSASAATLAGVGTYDGAAGFGSSNGVVTDSTLGSNYVYLTTEGGVTGTGLGLSDDTTGTRLTTNTFTAAVGEKLDLFFNYITSDGAGFADYAYVALNKIGGATITLFTARTTTSGDTVPGFGLPGIDPNVTLVPANTPIIPGGPAWSELGGSSGACWNAGCGYTGWINALYNFQEAGDYTLTFGVVNWSDTLFQSGLAIAGAKVGDVIIVDPTKAPLPAGGVLLLSALAGIAALRRRKAA